MVYRLASNITFHLQENQNACQEKNRKLSMQLPMVILLIYSFQFPIFWHLFDLGKRREELEEREPGDKPRTKWRKGQQ